MKKYRLKKDWIAAGEHYFVLRAGAEFKKDGARYIHKDSRYYFPEATVEDETEWFEEIKEPERIEVISIRANIYNSTITQVDTSKPIPQKKYAAIMSAIEEVLNEGEPNKYSEAWLKMERHNNEDWLTLAINHKGVPYTLSKSFQDWAFDILGQEIGRKQYFRWFEMQDPNKKYTEKDMEDCFRSAQLMDKKPAERGEFYYDGSIFSHSWKSFEDYLKAINK